MPEQTELERDLRVLESTLRKLETEYTMFFAGHLPKPPLETRARIEALLRRYDRAYVQSLTHRFRLNTIQSRFTAFAELWDRGLRAREEGRPGPFSKASRSTAAAPVAEAPPALPPDPNVQVTVSDPSRDGEKLQALYEALVEARRQTGNSEAVPFQRFAQLVATQVSRLRDAGSQEVAFRVAVKDGKVSLTAKGLKIVGQGDGKAREQDE